jgi:predicted Zn-dependent protease
MQHVNDALAVNPTYAPAHGLRGQLLARSGKVDEALDAFEAASRCARDSPLWPLERAKLLVLHGRPRDAIALLDPLLETAPELGDVYECMADAHLALGQIDDALGALEQGAHFRPGDIALQQRIQELRMSRDRHGPAVVCDP